MRTKATVSELGLYSSECCSEELIYDAGDVFLQCPKCRGLCGWELENPVISIEELERENGVAA